MSDQPTDRCAQLTQAYQQSRYRIQLRNTQHVDLYPGKTNAAMDALLQQHAVCVAHVITACNPRSLACPAAQNQRAMAALLQQIRQENWPWLPAQGQGLDTSWPPEDSYLLLGLDRSRAMTLALEHGQYALLEHCLGEPSRVLFTALWPADAPTQAG